jgi:hypothetical protein
MNAPVMVELEGETDPLEVRWFNSAIRWHFPKKAMLDEILKADPSSRSFFLYACNQTFIRLDNSCWTDGLVHSDIEPHIFCLLRLDMHKVDIVAFIG